MFLTKRNWSRILTLTLLPGLMGVVINNATMSNVVIAGSSGLSNLRMSMLGASLGYDADGEVYPEPAAINFGPTNFPRVIVQTFTNTSTDDCLSGQFTVPSDYVGGGSVVLVWASATGSLDAVWQFKYLSVSGTSTLDAAATSNTAVTSGSGTAESRVVVDLNAVTTAANDTMLYQLCRNGTSGSDTLTNEAHVYDLLLEYNS